MKKVTYACAQCDKQSDPVDEFEHPGKGWIRHGPGGAEIDYCSSECMAAWFGHEPVTKDDSH